MHVKELLSYADWTKGRLRTVLDADPEIWDREFETTSNFKSVRALTAHIAGAEERMTMRIMDTPRPDPSLEDRTGPSIADVYAHWDPVRERTRVLISRLSPADLAAVNHLSFPQSGVEIDKTVEQMLFHIFNHQTYHLAQVSMAMQRWGIDPPNFDAILSVY